MSREDSIPFLLPDSYEIFHSTAIKPDIDNIDHYYLVCYLYLLLVKDSSNSSDGSEDSIPITYNPTIQDFDISSNTFFDSSQSYTPQQVFKSLRNRLLIKTYPECKDTFEYYVLLSLTIDYCVIIGVLTTTNVNLKYRENDGFIDSSHWKVNSRRSDANNPKYHLEVIEVIKNKNPCIVTGGTGTGKTLVIPKLIYYYYRIYTSDIYFQTNIYSPDMIIAFPRKFLAGDNYSKYNSNLGYEVLLKFDKITKVRTIDDKFKEDSPLILLAGGERTSATNPPKPNFVIGTSESLYRFADTTTLAIVDEFHEHDLRSDILFAILKKKNAQLIIITATPSANDVKLFPKFLPNSNRINIVAKTPLEVNTIIRPYDSLKKKDYINKVKDIINSVAFKISYGQGILVFLPRIIDTERLATVMKDILKDFDILTFYSSNSKDNGNLIQTIEDSSKLLIIATQAAESSITFPTLVYVIDTGLEIMINVEPTKDIRSYNSKPVLQYINKYQYLQRKGRVGRTANGSVILLYDPSKLTEITKTILDDNLTSLVILMIKYNLTLDDLFVTPTDAQLTLYKKALSIVTSSKINISLIDLSYLKNIYWIETIIYLSTSYITKSDKDLYLKLWDSEEYNNYNSIYNNIAIKSSVPKRRLLYLYTKKDYHNFKELKTNDRVVISKKYKSKIDRLYYDQISIYYVIGV